MPTKKTTAKKASAANKPAAPKAPPKTHEELVYEHLGEMRNSAKAEGNADKMFRIDKMMRDFRDIVRG